MALHFSLPTQDSKLLHQLIAHERANEASFRSWKMHSNAANVAMNSWALADSGQLELMETSARISSMLSDCSDAQDKYADALADYRACLKEILTKEADLRTMLKNREMTLKRVLKLNKRSLVVSPDQPSFRVQHDDARRELSACESCVRGESRTIGGLKQSILRDALRIKLSRFEELGSAIQSNAQKALGLLDRPSFSSPTPSDFQSCHDNLLHTSPSPPTPEAREQHQSAVSLFTQSPRCSSPDQMHPIGNHPHRSVSSLRSRQASPIGFSSLRSVVSNPNHPSINQAFPSPYEQPVLKARQKQAHMAESVHSAAPDFHFQSPKRPASVGLNRSHNLGTRSRQKPPSSASRFVHPNRPHSFHAGQVSAPRTDQTSVNEKMSVSSAIVLPTAYRSERVLDVEVSDSSSDGMSGRSNARKSRESLGPLRVFSKSMRSIFGIIWRKGREKEAEEHLERWSHVGHHGSAHAGMDTNSPARGQKPWPTVGRLGAYSDESSDDETGRRRSTQISRHAKPLHRLRRTTPLDSSALVGVAAGHAAPRAGRQPMGSARKRAGASGEGGKRTNSMTTLMWGQFSPTDEVAGKSKRGQKSWSTSVARDESGAEGTSSVGLATDPAAREPAADGAEGETCAVQSCSRKVKLYSIKEDEKPSKAVGSASGSGTGRVTVGAKKRSHGGKEEDCQVGASGHGQGSKSGLGIIEGQQEAENGGGGGYDVSKIFFFGYRSGLGFGL